MKQYQKMIACAVGSVFALSMLAGCGGGTGTSKKVAARICYDNLPDDNIAIPAELTQYQLDGIESVTELTVSADGLTTSAAEKGSVAEFDPATGTVTAKGRGLAVCKMSDGSYFRIEVEPAYPTNPQNALTNPAVDQTRDASTVLGGTHDPSLIEVIEEDGTPTYYTFSTGWSDFANGIGNEMRKSKDMIHWDFIGKTFSQQQIDYMMANEVGNWLYNGDPEGKLWNNETNKTFASWWAPDIVPAPNGGYYLYTCVVDGCPEALTSGTRGVPVQSDYYSGNFTRACIFLAYSSTLEPQSFEYMGVLMQSSIPASGADVDVNAIDPQIIYSPEGNMYMAYGSFGTGNYMLELDPNTGLRKDGQKDWKTHDEIRDYIVLDITSAFSKEEIGWEHPYYGKNISKKNMEAPVIARHDDVKIFDETATFGENGEPENVEGKTYYYSMHSYNGLAVAYQMWGGRSESVWGTYNSVNGGIVYNNNVNMGDNSGNKYMGTFTWADKVSGIDIRLPGHNDLFTNAAGTNVAAYITRSESYGGGFVSQIHQYYLNSLGDIVINPNRYGGEINRPVTAEELFTYTSDRTFKMVAFANDNDVKTSVNVKLEDGGKITYEGNEIGTWQMYGNGYIKFVFNENTGVNMLNLARETVYYGVVRPAWLEDQQKSGFTITCMGHTPGSNMSFAMFMNNISTLSV